MNMPILRVPKNRAEKQTVAFRGVNYGEGALEGELSESRNLTSERFPCMSSRKARSSEAGYENVTGVFYKSGQFLVDGTNLYFDGDVIAQVTEGKKQFASINSKVVIYPDKILYDTDTGEVRTLGALFAGDAGMVDILDDKTIAVHQGRYTAAIKETGNIGGSGGSSMMLRDSTVFVVHETASINTETGQIEAADGAEVSASEVDVGTVFTKATMADGTVLIDLDIANSFAVVTKRYYYRKSSITPSNPEAGAASTDDGGSASDGSRSTNTNPKMYGFDYEIREVSGESYGTYLTFEEMGFREGDTVEIEGMTTFPDYNGTYNIRSFGTHTPEGGTEVQTMVFDADLFPEVGAEAGAVTIRRKTPELTVVCESNNRLWGAEGNTIYASALGDPTNFFTYDGLDTDSYAVAVASEGAFTGCCGFGNSVLFWKEDRLYKILGSYPSQYTMYEYNVPGVKNGSEGSLVNVNEAIYYHGRDGVYRYSGGSPELISENFGLRRFKEACAGAEGNRYCISMQDTASGEWGLWVYDIQRGLWLQEDDTRGVDFAYNEGKLFFIGDGNLLCVNPDEGEEAVAWSATTTRMDETYHNQKCYSRITLRADIPAGAWLQVEVSCDGQPFETVYTDHDPRARVRDIPIMPIGCDYFHIRLSGEGPVIIRSMVREYRLSRAVR